MSHLNLPYTVQKIIRDNLREMGKKDSEEIDSYSLLIEQADNGAESCDDVLNSESLINLSEVELCAKFGLNPDILQKEFSQLFESILQVFRFLKTGDVETYQDSEKLSPAEIFDDGNLSRDITQTLDLATILRMLILIHDRFKTTLLFSKQGLTRIPYHFDGKGLIGCDFNDANEFQIITKDPLKLEAFTSCRVKFPFNLYLKQLLIFVPTKNIQFYCTIIEMKR